MDTPIWSLALRRHRAALNIHEKGLVAAWSELVQTGCIGLIGPVRQELLSGVRHSSDFEHLRDRLCAFDDIPLVTADYERAALFFNTCRTKGIIGTPIDLLICAIADRLRCHIFTTDGDFPHYARCLPIHLYGARQQ